MTLASAVTGGARPLKDRLVAVKLAILWVAIILFRFPIKPFIGNEVDVLPVARQAVEKGWLANDWYLNLAGPYREAFNLLCGPLLTSGIGFHWGAFLLRLLLYAFLAYGFYSLFRALGLRFSLMLLALVIFLSKQSLVAEGWMVGGVEAKAFAYGFILLSGAAFLEKRYWRGFAFAGAAFSFHALVGAFSLTAIFGALVLNKGEYGRDWRAIAKSSWIFPLTGIFGLFALLGYLTHLHSGGGAEVTRAYEIYVGFRNPHHTLPGYWKGHYWIFRLVVSVVLLVATYLLSRSSRLRFIAAYALSSSVFFMVGLGLFALGKIPALRYYWFRLPDVLLPLTVSIVVAVMMGDLMSGKGRLGKLIERPGVRRALVGFIFLLVFLAPFSHRIGHTREESGDKASANQILPMLNWIRGHTPQGAVFLIDPTLDKFYVYAQRAQFVSFKHAPYQQPADVLEWYRRILLCNGGRRPQKSSFRVYPELRANYNHLSGEAIRAIAEQYKLDYYLSKDRRDLPFERVHSEDGYTLYRVN
jgi:hypothetical protein